MRLLDPSTVDMLFAFAASWATQVIVVLIVGLFLFGAGRYLRPLFWTRRALAAATKHLDSGKDPESLFARRPRLQKLWTQFLHNRKGTTVTVGSEEISTVDPDEVFTEEAVLEGYNRQMAFTLAGVFTGLGILGTFIGLVVGLHKVETDATEMMASITQLIGGMSTAFLTSIFGIVASLLWLFCDRMLLHSVQKQAVFFFIAVRRVYPVESADRLLHRLLAVEQEESAAIHRTNEILGEQGEVLRGGADALNVSNMLLEEQKAELQRLGADLATAFQDALNTSLGGHMAPLLERVATSIDNLSIQMGDRQVEAMDRMVTIFQDRLSEKLHDQFEGLAETLRKAADWQEQVYFELESLVGSMRDAATGQREMIERSTAAAELFQESLAGLGRTHELLTESAGAMARTFEGVAERVDSVAEGLIEAVERIDQQVGALTDRIQELGAQQELYRTANEEIRTHLAGHSDALSEQVQSLNEFWLGFRDDLSHLGTELRGSIAEFSVFTTDKLKEVFARFDSEMAKVVEHLSGTLAEVREITEDLPAGVERLRSTLGDSVRPIAEAGRLIGELPDAMERVAELTEGVARLQLSLEQALEPIGVAGRAVAELEGSLNGATDAPAGNASLPPLRSSIHEMVVRIGDSEASVHRLGAQLELVNERITEVLARMNQSAAAAE